VAAALQDEWARLRPNFYSDSEATTGPPTQPAQNPPQVFRLRKLSRAPDHQAGGRVAAFDASRSAACGPGVDRFELLDTGHNGAAAAAAARRAGHLRPMPLPPPLSAAPGDWDVLLWSSPFGPAPCPLQLRPPTVTLSSTLVAEAPLAAAAKAAVPPPQLTTVTAATTTTTAAAAVEAAESDASEAVEGWGASKDELDLLRLPGGGCGSGCWADANWEPEWAQNDVGGWGWLGQVGLG
jgi:hypothetical protein